MTRLAGALAAAMLIAQAYPAQAQAAFRTEPQTFRLRCADVNGAEVVMLEIAGTQGRIRYPVTRPGSPLAPLLGPLAGKPPPDGWSPLDHALVEPDQITGAFRRGRLSHPRFRIDRLTGVIEITGPQGARFSGRCEAMDEAVGERRF